MKKLAINQYMLRLVVSLIAGVFLVFSQLTMSHAMGQSQLSDDYGCEAAHSSVHASHDDARTGLNDQTANIAFDGKNNSHHGNADHCAMACSGVVLPTVIDSGLFKSGQARLIGTYIESASIPVQGLKRPPKS